MKHLMTGVAIAAALAIAVPASAQTPMSPSSPKPAASAPAPAAAPAQMKKKRPMMKRAMMRHSGRRGRMMAKSSNDSMTDQLNRQELSRLQGGMAPANAAPPMPMPNQATTGPRPSGR